MVMRAYKYRCYPTVAQIKQLHRAFGHTRFVWNWALDRRLKRYRRRREASSNVDASRLLTALKKTSRYRWLNEVPAVVYVQRLRDLDTAFTNFFAGRARLPRFKKRRHADSIRLQLDQRSVAKTFVAGERLVLPRLGALKLRWSRLPTAIPKMVTVSRDACGRYFVSLAVEEAVAPRTPATAAIGLDVGLRSLAVDSNGTVYANPRHLQRRERQLKRAQRALSRKIRGSGRWHCQRRIVARLHARVADSRCDHLHKLSSSVIDKNHAIALEDLNVSGMLKNRHLAKAIADVGWQELRRQLTCKAEWYERELHLVDRFAPSSKSCSMCGARQASMPLSVREWTCSDCGASHDRDVNAARNILAMSTAGCAGTKARGGWTIPSITAV